MSAQVNGELKTWHKTTFDFVADTTFSESAATFRDHRLDVTFTHDRTGTVIKVPGFFAADGDSANTGATSGSVWRVNFNAPLDGKWSYEASFRKGNDIAASSQTSAGQATGFDGESGSFSVAKSDKSGEDFRAKGMIIQDEGTHYLQHQGDGDYFVRGGPGVPENFLAMGDIDNTPDRHDYSTHLDDFERGGPIWDGGKGKAILGAIDYLAEQGQNSVYLMTLTAAGDGKDVWPWAATDLQKLSTNTANLDPDITSVYDVSKLAQWERIFDHMDEKGIYKNLFLQEMENDQLLNGGTDVAGTSLSAERLIYMREMIARFGHSNGIQWNLGEENTNSTQERIDMAKWAEAVDPYGHLVVIHTLRDKYDNALDPLRGVDEFDGPTFLATSEQIRGVVEEFRDKSAKADDPWVLSWDEDSTKVIDAYSNDPDSSAEKALREGLWGSFTAGASGFSWYVKGSSGHAYDQNMDTFDAFESIQTWTAAATDFFNDQIPFWEMEQADGLTLNGGDFVMADPGRYYVSYLPYGEADDVRLDLRGQAGENFDLYWYNPRSGGKLIADGTVSGGSVMQVGGAPSDAGKDWVLMARNNEMSGGPVSEEPVVEAPREEDEAPAAPKGGYYLEKDGIVKVQFEDVVGDTSGWVYQDGSNGNNPGFEGDGYYYWRDEGSTDYVKTAGQGAFTVNFHVQDAGTYNLFLRSSRDSNNPSDARNDIWVKVDGGTVGLMPDGTPPMVTSNGYTKLYGLNFDSAKEWHYSENFDDENTNQNPSAEVVLDKGMHSITFSGRSDGYHIDSFQLTRNDKPNSSLISSDFVGEDKVVDPTPTPMPEPEPSNINAVDDTATVAAGGSERIFVLGNDVGDVWIKDVSPAGNGTVSKSGGGYITYTPDDGFAGADTFAYTAKKYGSDATDTATVTVTVVGGEGNGSGSDSGGGGDAPDQGDPARLAVNAGGDHLTIGGMTYLADSFVSGAKSYDTAASISGTQHDALYQSESYGDFTYAFGLKNGDYEVTFNFAEIYFDKAGERVFDVHAEDNRVINDLDIYAEVGKHAAYDITVPVRITDGQLDLRFESEVNYAKLSGLAISPAEQGDDAGTPSEDFVAPFDLDGEGLAVADTFLFGFGVDGKSAPIRQSGGDIGIDDAGSDTEVDYRDGSPAGSEVIGFDFGEDGAEGIVLDLGGLSVVEGAEEGAIFTAYDARGDVLDDWVLTSNKAQTLEFDETVRFATLESSPWITGGEWPSQEPDFALQNFDIL